MTTETRAPREGDRVAITIADALVVKSSKFWLTYCVGGHDQYRVPTRAGKVTITVLTPDFRHNTLWLDKAGHLWLAQLDPEEHEKDVIRLISSLGNCSIAEALEYYGPFTPAVEFH